MSSVGFPATDIRGRTEPPSSSVRSAAIRLIPGAILVWALICGLGLLLTHVFKADVGGWDGSVDRWFAAHRSGGWNTITHVVSSTVETLPVIAVGLVLFVGLRIALGRWRESLFLAVVLIGEVTIFVCATLVIHRHRPAVAHLDSAPPTSSFPSGHTAASVALYGGVAVIAWCVSRRGWLRGLTIALAILVPIAVALSRLYRGMHYPTDVVGGALLGVLWLAIVTRVMMVKRR